jgi:hypothetical protein
MTVNCPECGGSGVRWGFNREIECFDCGGEGQWEDERCKCGEILNDGECAVCDRVLLDLRATMEMQKRRRAA